MNSSSVDLTQLSATELGIGLRAKKWTATEITQAHLDRIEQINPRVNAIVTHTPEIALVQAAKTDRDIRDGNPVGLLAGIPIAYKDTHDVAGVRTTYGSPIFAYNSLR